MNFSATSPNFQRCRLRAFYRTIRRSGIFILLIMPILSVAFCNAESVPCPAENRVDLRVTAGNPLRAGGGKPPNGIKGAADGTIGYERPLGIAGLFETFANFPYPFSGPFHQFASRSIHVDRRFIAGNRRYEILSSQRRFPFLKLRSLPPIRITPYQGHAAYGDNGHVDGNGSLFPHPAYP